MKTGYSVERAFSIKDSMILVLNRKMDLEDFDKKYIKDKDTRIPYRLTHNDFFIMIDERRDLSGHQIEFC